MPLQADAVRAIRADPQRWESASGHPPFCDPWGDEPLPDISRALLTVLPAGAGWVDSFGDRSFQQAEYLLDPVAYRTRELAWEQREESGAYRIIHGAEVFAGHATTGQGFAWRCSSNAFLAAAVDRIDHLDVTAVRREFSVAEMSHLGLYKVYPEEDDEHAFSRVLVQFRGFAEHCRRAVAQGLDLIITLY